MSLWKQILLSLAVVGGLGFLWFSYFPGARAIVERQPFYKALVASAPQSAGPANDAKGAGGVPPGAAPGAPPGARPGATPGAPPAAGGRPGGGRGGMVATVVARPATVETMNTRVSALGTGAALHSVTVLPSASGRLIEVPAEAGQTVRAGDLLARLDAETETIARDRARLALEDARATLARNQALAQSNAVSATQIQQAQLAVSNAELALRSAEVALENRSILAPIDGTLGLVQVSPGNEVSGQTVIATIEDDSAILVNFWLPEILVGSVRVGDTATAVPVARPGISIPARVVGIDNKVDAASGTYEVQARLENEGQSLRPGMSFTLSMSFEGEVHVAVDPLSILWGSDGAYVWRLEGEKVSRVAIRIIQRNSETVLVSGELAEGDLIVTEGLEGLTPGATVKVAGSSTGGPSAGGPAAGGPAAGGPGADGSGRTGAGQDGARLGAVAGAPVASAGLTPAEGGSGEAGGGGRPAGGAAPAVGN